MEARRTKVKGGSIEELPDAPGDTRRAVGRRESPHAAACRAIDAARRDNDASDPMPSIAPAKGPPVCTACRRIKAPLGQFLTADQAARMCTDECYAYRWSPTPPNNWPATKQEGTETP